MRRIRPRKGKTKTFLSPRQGILGPERPILPLFWVQKGQFYKDSARMCRRSCIRGLWKAGNGGEEGGFGGDCGKLVLLGCSVASGRDPFFALPSSPYGLRRTSRASLFALILRATKDRPTDRQTGRHPVWGLAGVLGGSESASASPWQGL